MVSFTALNREHLPYFFSGDDSISAINCTFFSDKAKKKKKKKKHYHEALPATAPSWAAVAIAIHYNSMRVIYLFLCVFYVFEIFLQSLRWTHEDINQILLNYFESWERTPSILMVRQQDIFGPRPPVLQMTFQLFFLL